MTYAPGSIAAAAKVWTDHGGTNLGIVGDAAHTWGYHCGRDRLFSATGHGWDDVSVRTARDRAGLTDAASALDLGHTDKRVLRAFTGWLIDRCRANAPETADLREVIGSLDGVNTIYYDRERNVVATNAAGVDSSHLWHTHLSFYRDSESRDKTGIFAPYWGGAASGGTSDMGVRIRLLGTVDTTPLDAFGTAKVGGSTITLWRVDDAATMTLPAGADLGVVQAATAVNAVGSYPAGTDLVALNVAGVLYVTAKAAVIYTPLPVAPADCTAAVAAATTPLNTRIATMKAKAAAFAADVADD